MALTFLTTGLDVSCERYEITATTDNPSNVAAVEMQIFVEGFGSAPVNVLEHVKNIGSSNQFTFEVNDVLRNFFERQLVALSATNTHYSIKNVLATLEFREVINNVVQTPFVRQFLNLKNFALDVFESDKFVTQNGIDSYDCGDAGSATSKFLTSSPNKILVNDFRRMFLSVLKSSYTGGTTPKQRYVIRTYGSNGLLFNTSYVNVDVTSRTQLGGSTAKYDISTLMLNMSSINNAKFITVRIEDILTPFTPRSEFKRFDNSNFDCSRIQGVVVHWINEFGVQESYTFSGDFMRTLRTDREYLKKTRPVNPQSTDVGSLSYSSSFNYEYTLYTARIDQATAQWLSKMLINGRCAIENFTETDALRYFPIEVLTTDVEDFGEFNPTTLLSIKFRMSNERRGLV